MPGIPRGVIEHKLGIDPSYKLVKRKKIHTRDVRNHPTRN
jgi:hypothetical protein